MKTTIRLLFFGLVPLLAGCAAYTPRVAQMVPDVGAAPRPNAPTIRVLPVKGGEKATPSDKPFDAVKLDDETFQQALIDTLKQQGLFEKVLATGPADYELQTQILGQRARVGREFHSMSAILLVAYRLVDLRSGRTIWDEHLLSLTTAERDSGPKTSVAHAGTVMAAYELAVRENLQQMLQRMRDAVSAPSPSSDAWSPERTSSEDSGACGSPPV